METLVSLLATQPNLALPDWNKPFRLHTDASGTGAEVVLTQIEEMIEKTLAYASHRWSKTDEKNHRLVENAQWCFKRSVSSPHTSRHDHSPSSRTARPSPGCLKVRLSPRSILDGHDGLVCSTTRSSSGDLEPNTKSSMRYRAPMTIRPVEPLSTTPS